MGDIPFIAFSGLLFLLNLAPFYWQIRQGNSGPVSMGFWVITLNFKDFVNTTVWFDDVVNRAPVWCDISNKLRVGGELGRIASVMCIARFLAAVVSPKATAITREDRRQRAIFDYSLCFGGPAVVAACEIIYQPVRFALVRTLGCEIVHSNTWALLVLRLVWPPIFATVGVLYSSYTIYRLVKHRRNFGRVVAGSHSALTTSRFIRLAALSFSYLVIGLPLTIFSTVADIASSGAYADYSWSYLHTVYYSSPILYYPYAFDQNKAGLKVWSNVIAAILFFCAFGFGTEALAIYSRLAVSLNPRRAGKSPYADRHGVTVSSVHVAPPKNSFSPEAVGRYDGAFRIAYDQECRSVEMNGIKVVVDRSQETV